MPPAPPLQVEADVVAPLTAATPASGEMRDAQDTPPKAAAAKAQGKKKSANKTKKSNRKAQKRAKRR